MEFKSVWTIFIRPDPNQTWDSLPGMLKEVYSDDNLNQLMAIWSEYDPTEKQQSEMWSISEAALQFGILEVYLAIEDAKEIDRYFVNGPYYEIEIMQTRILKTPQHLINAERVKSCVNWFNRFYKSYSEDDIVDAEDIPF